MNEWLTLIVVCVSHSFILSLFHVVTMNSFPLNDSALWHAFKQGDRVAFERIYAQQIQPLINYGYKITADRNLIQDCIQDLFVELWESRERLTNTDSIRFYLLKALRNKLLRQLQNTPTDSLQEWQPMGQEESFEVALFTQETLAQHSAQLTNVLEKLPKRQREAIHLRYFQELSNEEVAEVMGVNYQSACKFIYTALKTLREKLQLSGIVPLLLSMGHLCREFSGSQYLFICADFLP